MRTIEYLSPTSKALFERDPVAFYRMYLADNKTPRDPQTQAMAAGSAFDAYIKSDLYKNIVKGDDVRFKFEPLFEAQVEAHNRTWAMIAGRELFEMYVKVGAYTDILTELSTSIIEPRFEIDLVSPITRTGKNAVPIKGKPDIFFVSSGGAHVIPDWKCNGYVSPKRKSPSKGYVKLRPGSAMHAECMPMKYKGITINAMTTLDQVDEGWANQLCVYAWLCGEEIGSQFVVGIEQLLNCDRVASFRCLIPREYQEAVFDDYERIWKIIQSGWIFRDLTEKESHAKQRTLDGTIPDPEFNNYRRVR